MNILIYFDGLRLGDTMMFMPALKALREKKAGAHITILCGVCPAYVPLVQLVADTIIAPKQPYKSVPSLWQPNNLSQTISRHYDLIIDTRSRFITTMALRQIPCDRFLRRKKTKSDAQLKQGNVGQSLLNLFSQAIGEDLRPALHWSLNQIAHETAAQLLSTLPKKPLIAITPGASTISRCIPIETFIAVANQVRQAHFIFILGPLELNMCGLITSSLVNGSIIETEDSFLTMALAGKMRLTVANDSGGGHLLAATSPTHISIFNRPDYPKWLPWSQDQHTLVAKNLGLKHISEIGADFLSSYISKLL